MMKPNEEQIKRFWEHFGWRHCESNLWLDPEGYSVLSRDSESLPISLDLDNLFKYAVPKVFRMGFDDMECRLDSRRDGDGYMWLLTSRYLGGTKRSDYLTDPSLALFWAIYKVIEDEA